jgi:hypothetical protein
VTSYKFAMFTPLLDSDEFELTGVILIFPKSSLHCSICVFYVIYSFRLKLVVSTLSSIHMYLDMFVCRTCVSVETTNLGHRVTIMILVFVSSAIGLHMVVLN